MDSSFAVPLRLFVLMVLLFRVLTVFCFSDAAQISFCPT
jgi:hypothetical protein